MNKRERIVRWVYVAGTCGVLWGLVHIAIAQDTSYLACPAFTKDAAGKMVRTSSCTWRVKAPLSPGVDTVCARTTAGVDLTCVPAAPGATVSLVTPAAVAGKGHVVFSVYSVDSDSALGRLDSPASDRSGVLVDLDLSQMLQVIVDAIPAGS